MTTALILGPEEKTKLAAIRELASLHPVDMIELTKHIHKDRHVKAVHKAQMTAQSTLIPLRFMVTFSIETGHGAGTCRHMSMSLDEPGRVPNQHAVWMVAEELGFVGGLEQCVCWIEELEGHGQAVNVVQPLKLMEASKEVQ